MRKVVVFGTFDIIHPGHLHFLEQAKKQGDHLIVVVSRDSRVVLEKKRKPFFNEKDRLAIVESLKVVDKALLGDKAGEWSVLKKLSPDVICMGYDQKAEWLNRCDLTKKPKLVKIKKYRQYSSSKIGACPR